MRRMSELTLDEAIKHCLEVAENNEQFASGKWIGSEGEANRQECEQCAADHRQLAEWLTELKEAKRLLKAAIEDLSCGGENNKCTKSCKTCTHSSIKGCGCRYYGEYHWRYTDEALNLINDEK